jgi:hypothetical protein
MRIAICFSGQPRYIEEGFFYVKKNILDKYENVDVFVHSWWSSEYINKGFIGTNVKRDCFYESDTVEKIKKYYNPIDCIFEKQIHFDINHNINYGKQNPLAVYSMFYSIYKSNQLKSEYESKNNFKYDLVIRCRFDIVINYFDLNLSDKDKYIFVGGEHHHGGQSGIPNDQFAISSSQNMDLYSSVYKNIFDYSKDNHFYDRDFVGEEILKYHFTNKNIFYFTKNNELLTNGWWQYSRNDCNCWDKYNCGEDIGKVLDFKNQLLI